MKVTYSTDIGLVRSSNQDSVFVHMFTDNAGFFIVADGMGGHCGGEYASSAAVEIISGTLISGYKPDLSSQQIYSMLNKAIKLANTNIYNQSLEKPSLNGMGTTVIVNLIVDKVMYTASVGDSRTYVFNGTRLYQITTDHTLVENLKLNGIITDEEAVNHPQKHVITRAVGSEEDILVDFFETVLENDFLILSCTDGLYNMVDEKEIVDILKTDSEEYAKQFINRANEQGGRDNITVVTAKIS